MMTLPRLYLLPLVLTTLVCSTLALPTSRSSQSPFAAPRPSQPRDAKVLVLGGGVAGVIAARTLHEQGISEFIIVEARHELGGRLMSHTFGVPGREYTVELGANWVQGTQSGNGPENPIWTLAKKHGLQTQHSSYFDGLSTFDETGPVDYIDVFNASVKNFDRLIASAGARVPKGLVDASARSGYSLTGSSPQTPHEMASEYYQFDWEFTSTPEESSWIAASWNNNSTFSGFSEENVMSVDPRGFKSFLQSEADTFLEEEQVRLNSTVSVISYTEGGVRVALTDGQTLTADYVICTFSLGVLQHQDVQFQPPLPLWKREAIHSMNMGVYTKIFLQFPYKFWFDTETGLYADRERGRYPIWESLDHPNYFPGSGILFCTVTGAFSRRISTLPTAILQNELLSVLSSMFPPINTTLPDGTTVPSTIPEPIAMHFHSWNDDPLFRGSYANWPPAFLAEHHANLRADLQGRVWFAGEATSKLYFGYLQGAYFEGQDIGMNVAECIQAGGCLGLEHVELVKNARPYDIV